MCLSCKSRTSLKRCLWEIWQWLKKIKSKTLQPSTPFTRSKEWARGHTMTQIEGKSDYRCSSWWLNFLKYTETIQSKTSNFSFNEKSSLENLLQYNWSWDPTTTLGYLLSLHRRACRLPFSITTASIYYWKTLVKTAWFTICSKLR